jgi:hypothetical protein
MGGNSTSTCVLLVFLRSTCTSSIQRFQVSIQPARIPFTVAHEVVLADLSLLSSCVNNYRSLLLLRFRRGWEEVRLIALRFSEHVQSCMHFLYLDLAPNQSLRLPSVILLRTPDILGSQLSCLTGQIPDVITVCLAENAVRNQYYKSCPLKQHESNHAKQLSPTNNT